MSRRTRTTKKLAQRIDLQYFARPHPFRRWRFWLAAAVPALLAVWVAWLALAGNNRVYSSGPMSSAHAVFGNDCAACHMPQSGSGFFREVSDTACLACHDGPIHNERQTFTPGCGSCHVDHRGAVQLAHAADVSCTQCHAGLKVKSGQTIIVPAITGFTGLHPQFRAAKAGATDPGVLALNHKVHMKPGLLGPAGSRRVVQMECVDCHRTPAVEAPWPYGTAQLQTTSANTTAEDPLAPQPTRAYMAPIKYEKQCAACHTLEFDKRFADQAPHDGPQIVMDFVVKEYRDYISQHPEEARRVIRFDRQLTGEPPRTVGPARNAEEWVRWQVEEAERLLWRKTCKQCHTLQFGGDSNQTRNTFGAAIPTVAKPNMPVTWMPHARFSHDAHRMLECTSCHAQATTSTETRDVLLPRIETCQKCHTSGEASAGENCYVCHTYHDWSKRKEIKGRYSIHEVRGSETKGRTR